MSTFNFMKQSFHRLETSYLIGYFKSNFERPVFSMVYYRVVSIHKTSYEGHTLNKNKAFIIVWAYSANALEEGMLEWHSMPCMKLVMDYASKYSCHPRSWSFCNLFIIIYCYLWAPNECATFRSTHPALLRQQFFFRKAFRFNSRKEFRNQSDAYLPIRF